MGFFEDDGAEVFSAPSFVWGGETMGRRAQAVELHLLRGNPNRLTKDEILRRKEAEGRLRPPSDRVEPPQWLGEDAKAIFVRIADDLRESELLTNVDIWELAVLCDAIVKHAEASREVDKRGITVTGSVGSRVKNPAITAVMEYAGLIARLAPRFGLDPQGRVSLTIPSGHKVDQLDLFGEMFEQPRERRGYQTG